MGSITLELLIAFAILVMATAAVILVVFGNQSLAVSAQTNNEALSRAQEMLEEARALSRNDFSSVVSKAAVTQQSGPLTYAEKLDVMDLDSFSKQATSTVSWTTGGQTFSIVLSTILANPAAVSGNLCSPSLAGDWTAPQIYGYVDFPSPKGASGVAIKNGKAYISADPSSAVTNDFYVADVSGAGPGVTSLPILGQFSTSLGLTDVKVAGNYAFVTADSALNQLLVIDVTDPANLDRSKIVRKIDLTAAGDTAVGNTLAYSAAGKKLYVGLTNSLGKEFHMFCVAPDPTYPACATASFTNPIEMGPGYEVGDTINHITLGKNNIVYLAVASVNQQTQIIALNMSNPNSPALADKYSPAPNILTGQSLALDSSAGTLYFGRTGGSANPKFMALNTSNLSSAKWTSNMSSQSGIFSMVLRSNILFMTTSDPNDGLQIWDVANPAGPPTRYDTSPLNIQQGASAGTDCFGNLLYVAQRSNRAMQVIGPFTPFSYSLAAQNSTVTVTQGNSGTDTINATLISGISQNATFSANIPIGATGVTASFSLTKCTPNCSTTITLNTSASTPAGSYTITVNGTGGISTSFTLTVNAKLTPTMSTILYNSTTGTPLFPQPGPVSPGTVVYDKTTIIGPGPTPTGTVTFVFYKNKNNCTGASQTSTVTVTVGSASSATYTVKHNDTVSYQATYNGNANYTSTTGACQPLNGN